MPYTDPEIVSIIFENTQELDNDERDLITKIEKRFVRPQINSALDSQYNVPFDSLPDTPTIITSIASMLTAHYFAVFPGSAGSDHFEYAKELREEAKEILNRLAEGEETISDYEEKLDDSSFTFDGAKSDAFNEQTIFLGRISGPTHFGDSDAELSDTDAIER